MLHPSFRTRRAVGVSVSGAGAFATNIILTTTNAYVSDSTITSAKDVVIEASNLSKGFGDRLLIDAQVCSSGSPPPRSSPRWPTRTPRPAS